MDSTRKPEPGDHRSGIRVVAEWSKLLPEAQKINLFSDKALIDILFSKYSLKIFTLSVAESCFLFSINLASLRLKT